MNAQQLLNLKASDLVSVYSGKSGKCSCGCSGTHRYWNAEEGTADRGYTVSPDEVNQRFMNTTLKTIQRNADQAEGWDNIWSYDSGTRVYVAYVRAVAR